MSTIANKITTHILPLLLLLASCTMTPRGGERPTPPPLPAPADSGALICRSGNGTFSTIFRRYATTTHRFSHIGILSYENDTAYIYHSEATEQNDKGNVRRQKATTYLHNMADHAAYRLLLPAHTRHKLLTTVRHYHKTNIPFDFHFDSTDTTSLYCTEMVATALNTALDTTLITPTLHLLGHTLYTIDDILRPEITEEIQTREGGKYESNKEKNKLLKKE